MSKPLPLAAYDDAYADRSPLAGQPFATRIGVYLWRSSMTEHIAAATFQKLARWARLSEAEQATARLFAEQERNHAELLRALGQEWARERPDAYIRSLRVPEEPWLLLAGVHQAERISFVGFEHMKALGHRIGHPVLTAVYDLITREERLHLEWGRPLVRRLLRDRYLGPAMGAYLRLHPIAREYRAVRQERPWAGLGSETVQRDQDQIERDPRTGRLEDTGRLRGQEPGEGDQVGTPIEDVPRQSKGGAQGSLPEDLGQWNHEASLP